MMNVALQARGMDESKNQEGVFSLFTIATIVILTICYWFIDHRWDQSVYYAGIDELTYTGSENSTADRLSEVNAASTISRLLIAGWAAVCFFTRKQSLRWDSMFLWVSIAGAAMLCSSILWSIKPTHSLFKLVVLATVSATAFGFASRFTLKELFNILCCSCLSFIVIGIVAEIAHGKFRPWGDYRFIGTSHPNTLAIYAALLCMSARMYLVKDQSKTIAITLLAIGAIVIVMTKSRTTLGAVLLSMIATQIVSVRGNNRVILIVGAFFLAGFVSFGSLFLSQQATGQLGNVAAMGRTEDVSSLTGRLPLWEELLTSINKRPWLGYGYLAYWDAARVEYLSDTFKWEIPHGHNMYLDIILDVGLIGLMLFLIWYSCAMYTAFVRFNETNRIEYAIVVGLGVFAIANGFAESLFKLPTFHLLVLLCAYCSLLFESASGRATPAENRNRRVNLQRRTA